MTRTLLFSIAAAAALTAGPAAAARAQQRPPAPVVVAPVVRKTVSPRRSFVGTVRAVQSAVVGCESAGRVVEMSAREGARVAKGEAIAKLRTTTLEIALRAAQADLELRRQELAELRAGTRPEELRQGESRAAAAKCELEFAQWDDESADRLRETGSISEDELRRVRLRLRTAQQEYAQAQAALELLRAGPRKERIAQAEARTASQKAAVERLDDELERRTIRAPFDGVVVAERTEVGEWLAVGAPVVDFESVGDVDVRVGVVEDVVPALRIGGRALVTVGAFPGRTFEGRIATIVPRGDERTRTFPVDVRVASGGDAGGDTGGAVGAPRLAPGMFARVSLEVGAPAPALLVPKDALVLGGRAPVVYVVVPGKEGAPATVRPVAVRTGVAVDGDITVEAQLAPGDLVVTRGNERLRPGQPVTVIPASGARPAAKGDAPPPPAPAGESGTGRDGDSGDSSPESGR